ncbi:salivary C-type lectin 2-like [Saccoglossus kowalevskii]|uniref:Alpha-N-acetylgalactosamine-specific lectin-like n=1 Tax=Saccoglossus kowalevskii TaxID=10224 RepID=A0ABM0MCQ3_SACKO|nr:PREDICTED: alpha-N-acetylgalactosamine-specific lectin-like [Saccoglossus kowalevskii]
MYPEQISNLAVVSTKALRLSLTSYIKSDTTLSFGRIGRGYWVGCNDIENEGHFIWADGTEVDDQNWEKRQPNNNNGQHCCQMWQHPKNKPRFKLDDETCSKKKGYICQIKNGCSE